MSLYYQDDFVTLYHGDCLELLPTFNSYCTPGWDAVVTDPPYNIGKAYWDTIPDYLAWCEEWVLHSLAGMKRGGAVWYFHSDPFVMAGIGSHLSKEGLPLASFVTLDKSHWSIAKRYKNAGTVTFPAATEYAALHRENVYAQQIKDLREGYGMSRAEMDTIMSPSRKPTGLTYRWEAGDSVPGDAEVELFVEKFAVELIRPTFHNADKYTNVWRFDQPEAVDHPTPKPLAIMERCVSSTTMHGEIILDPFAGSGTTLLAAKNLGRKSIGIERDERYCEIIAKRCAQEVLDFGALT